MWDLNIIAFSICIKPKTFFFFSLKGTFWSVWISGHQEIERQILEYEVGSRLLHPPKKMDSARILCHRIMFSLFFCLREETSYPLTFLSVVFASHLGGRVLLAGVKEN